MKILKCYEKQTRPLPLCKDAIAYLIQLTHGDGRYLLNLIETVASFKKTLDLKELQEVLREKAPLFDKDTDQHYNLISALHKSVRGPDPDAALYWFSRMIIGGEDPLFIARRCIRMASEDVGRADPQALALAIAASDAYQMLGSPEGELALAQVLVYLALAPKSNASYVAFLRATEAAMKTHHKPPLAFLNAPTPLMKKMEYRKGYIYDHSNPEGFSGQNYFPEGMRPPSFYQIVNRGLEGEILKYLEELKKKRRES